MSDRDRQGRVRKDVEFADDEPCGCGSDQAYAECCKHARAKYVRRGHRTVFRQVALTPEALDVFDETKSHFRNIFGRMPSRGDKVFAGTAFRHSPMDFDREFERIADEAGIRRELVYARRQTDGLILTADTFDLASPSDRAAWTNAIERYRAAAENGIDLLLDRGSVACALGVFSEFLEHAVIHLGSYADRAPRRVKSSLPIFFQFMLISRCHQCLKIIADHWEEGVGDEAFSLLRTIYECTLLIARLELEPTYADTLLAQALAGSEIFPYRKRKDGRVDYSTVVDVRTETGYRARNSFGDCAKAVGHDAIALFDILYPTLSSRVHFDSLEMLQQYRRTGSFIIWQDIKREGCAIVTAIVIDYLASWISRLSGSTRILCRDAQFLYTRAMRSLGALICALDDEDRDVEPTLMILTFAAMHNFVMPHGPEEGSAPE